MCHAVRKPGDLGGEGVLPAARPAPDAGGDERTCKRSRWAASHRGTSRFHCRQRASARPCSCGLVADSGQPLRVIDSYRAAPDALERRSPVDGRRGRPGGARKRGPRPEGAQKEARSITGHARCRARGPKGAGTTVRLRLGFSHGRRAGSRAAAPKHSDGRRDAPVAQASARAWWATSVGGDRDGEHRGRRLRAAPASSSGSRASSEAASSGPEKLVSHAARTVMAAIFSSILGAVGRDDEGGEDDQGPVPQVDRTGDTGEGLHRARRHEARRRPAPGRRAGADLKKRTEARAAARHGQAREPLSRGCRRAPPPRWPPARPRRAPRARRPAIDPTARRGPSSAPAPRQARVA